MEKSKSLRRFHRLGFLIESEVNHNKREIKSEYSFEIKQGQYVVGYFDCKARNLKKVVTFSHGGLSPLVSYLSFSNLTA